MHQGRALALALFGALAIVSCGGGGSPTTPTNPPSGGGGGGGSNIVTITIKAVDGKLSFDPNPATVGAGQLVVFKNNDKGQQVHHVTLDDGTAQTGDIAPGQSSQPISIGSNKSYHCMNHPSMVGSFNGNATPDPPPCTGYCG
jgi:plastocyanin